MAQRNDSLGGKIGQCFAISFYRILVLDVDKPVMLEAYTHTLLQSKCVRSQMRKPIIIPELRRTAYPTKLSGASPSNGTLQDHSR